MKKGKDYMMETKKNIELFNLSNGNIDVVLCNYGCTVVSINVPCKNGVKKNVLAGLSPELSGYITKTGGGLSKSHYLSIFNCLNKIPG
jgi:hypothetical protein